MVTNTPIYNFNLPTEGSDDDVWGGFLNDNWESVETVIKALADRVQIIEDQYKIPVGGLYLSTSDTDPKTTLGYGQWAAHAQGRAIVGVGTADNKSWTAGQTRGTAEVSLSNSELPSHTHTFSASFTTDEKGDHQHELRESYTGDDTNIPSSGFTGADATYQWATRNMRSAGNHKHNGTVSGTTDPKGNGAAHQNLQPSIGVYVWKRTS